MAVGRTSVADFLVLARDLSAGLAAFYVGPGGATSLAVSPSSEGSELLERRLRLIAAESHGRVDSEDAVIIWESDVPASVERGVTTLGNSLRAVAVPVASGSVDLGLLGIADYWLPEPVSELRRVLRDVAAELADFLVARNGAGTATGGATAHKRRAAAAAAAATAPSAAVAPAAAGGRTEKRSDPARLVMADDHLIGANSERDADAFMTELANNIPDGLIVTMADGTIVFVNRQMAEMSQRAEGELLGMDVSSIFESGSDATGTRAAFSPRPGSVAFLLDTPPHGRLFDLRIVSGERVPIEVRGTFFFSAFAGECYVALVRLLPSGASAGSGSAGEESEAGETGWVGTAEPEPRAIGAEEEESFEEQREPLRPAVDARHAPAPPAGPARSWRGAGGDDLTSIFESLDEGVLACDGNGIVLFANAAASELQGLTRTDVLLGRAFPAATGLRRSDGTTVSPSDHPLVRALAGTVVEGEALTLIDEEGDRRRVVVSARPYALPSGDGALLLLHDATAESEAETRRVNMALRDPLTGLANRELLLDYMHRSYEQLKTRGGEVVLIYIDLADFKRVNDEHGWEAGDETLVAVSRRISRSVRSSDLVARPGGDEFVVLPTLPAPDMVSTEMIAERLRSVVCAPYLVRGRSIKLEASVACVSADARNDDPGSMLVRASREMYRQRRGRMRSSGGSTRPGKGMAF